MNARSVEVSLKSGLKRFCIRPLSATASETSSPGGNSLPLLLARSSSIP